MSWTISERAPRENTWAALIRMNGEWEQFTLLLRSSFLLLIIKKRLALGEGEKGESFIKSIRSGGSKPNKTLFYTFLCLEKREKKSGVLFPLVFIISRKFHSSFTQVSNKFHKNSFRVKLIFLINNLHNPFGCLVILKAKYHQNFVNVCKMWKWD